MLNFAKSVGGVYVDNNKIYLKKPRDGFKEKYILRPADMYNDGWCEGCSEKYLNCVIAGECKGCKNEGGENNEEKKPV